MLFEQPLKSLIFIKVPNTGENANETKDKPKRKKTKTIIKKSRLERQISNAQHVLDKYIPGKTLGKNIKPYL